MNADEAQIQLADYIGAQLKGRPASPCRQTRPCSHQTRKFGLVYISTGQDAETQTDHFVQSLAKYGVQAVGPAGLQPRRSASTRRA